MKLIFIALLKIAVLCFISENLAAASEPFSLTSKFDIGGGGCVGETRIYDELVILSEKNKRNANPGSSLKIGINWEALDNRLSSSIRYFLTTVGCGADQVAISIDGKAFVLDAHQLEELGSAATYYSDTAPNLRVRIETVEVLHSLHIKETECTKFFKKVRVRIEFRGRSRTVAGTSIGGCS
jgi:hypothetical protein